jgi:Tol biopolymer transport system component
VLIPNPPQTQILGDSDLQIGEPAWSPDGTRIVFTALEPGEDETKDTDIYIINVDGSGLIEVPNDQNNAFVSWSPDGGWLAFHSSGNLAIMRPDGSDYRRLYEPRGGAPAVQPAWSPDSERLVVALNNYLVVVVDIQSGEASALPGQLPGECGVPQVAFAPDGIHVALRAPDCSLKLYNINDPEEVSIMDLPDGGFPGAWGSNFYPQWGGG